MTEPRTVDEAIPMIEEMIARCIEQREGLRQSWIKVMVDDPEAPMHPELRRYREDLIETAAIIDGIEHRARILLEKVKGERDAGAALADLVDRANRPSGRVH